MTGEVIHMGTLAISTHGEHRQEAIKRTTTENSSEFKLDQITKSVLADLIVSIIRGQNNMKNN